MMTEDGLFHVAVVDDEDPTITAVYRAALSPELKDGNSEFIGARSLSNFLGILERLQKARQKLHLVLQDGTILFDTHGLDIIELIEWGLKRELLQSSGFPGHLKHLEEFEERFYLIHREVYEGVHFILLTGGYSKDRGGWYGPNNETLKARHERILRESPGLLFPQVLEKPFTVEALRAAVFKVLGIREESVSRS